MVLTRRQAASLSQEVSPERRAATVLTSKQVSSKRKLFNSCKETGLRTEPSSPCQTFLSAGKKQIQSQPSPPPTPKTVDRERPSTCTPATTLLHPTLEPAMIYTMQRWRANLIALQPKVQVSDATMSGAMAIMREFACMRPDLTMTLHTSAPHLFTYTGAALWLVSKFGDVRTAVPNRTLMSQACHIHPQALSDFEMDLCLSIDWEVTRVLRANNLV